jgi:aspartate aminotransferase-like enzyme
MARPMIDHRGPEFSALLRDVTARLQPFFDTTSDVLCLTGSGTGALEAAVVNVLSPGDRVLAVSIGYFGDRFREIAGRFGAAVEPLSFPAGQAADPDHIRQALRERGPFRAVLVTHNETSTGVTNDLATIAAVVHETDALLLVDAISSLSSVPFHMDAWGCDLVLSGSQKGWMVPPGLAVVGVSPRAWQATESARMPRYYWDFGKARQYLARGQTPATPAVSLFFAFQAALDRLEAEGRDNVYARHQRCAEQVRRGIQDLGLRLFADPAHASNTVTAVEVPAGVDSARLLALLRERGVVLSGGQGALAGKIFRIGHLGWIDVPDVAEILMAIGETLPLARQRSSAMGE